MADPPPTLSHPRIPTQNSPEKEDVETVLKGMDLEDEGCWKPFHVRFILSSERAISQRHKHKTSGIHWYLECECKNHPVLVMVFSRWILGGDRKMRRSASKSRAVRCRTYTPNRVRTSTNMLPDIYVIGLQELVKLDSETCNE